MGNYVEAIQPFYKMQNANEDIPLFDGEVKVFSDDWSILAETANCSVVFKWLPTPSLRGTILLSNSNLDNLAKNIIVELPQTLGIIYGTIVSAPIVMTSEKLEHKFIATAHNITASNENAVDNIYFHLPNFFQYSSDYFYGELIAHHEGGQIHLSHSRINIPAEDISIKIDPINSCDKDLFQQLKSEGGFAITHVGKVTSKNKLFTYDEAIKIKTALHYFLSFARGFRCSPILLVGTKNNVIIWKDWMSPVLTSYRRGEFWLPYHIEASIPDLSKLWLKIYENLNQGDSGTPIKLLIHLYIIANTGVASVEGSIILLQAAFELLCNLINGDCKGSAPQKLRYLFEHYDIPLPEFKKPIVDEFFNYLPHLDKNSLKDSATAITWIRNASTHAKPSRVQTLYSLPKKLLVEIQDLGVYYLEMCILRYLDYHGLYCNSLMKTTREEATMPVPWKSKE